MYRVFNKVNGEFLKDENGELAYSNIKDAEFAIKVSVMAGNDWKLNNHRWTKKDFIIVNV